MTQSQATGVTRIRRDSVGLVPAIHVGSRVPGPRGEGRAIGTPGARSGDLAVPLSEHAYRSLHRLIVSCELAPGQRISELQLQEYSGQQRTPTREAATRLIAEQLLEVIPRRGYRITPVSVESATQLLDVFDLLMSQVMRTAQFEPVAAARLRAFVEQPPPDESPSRLASLLDFSETLSGYVVSEIMNPWLGDILGRLMSHVERLWTFAFSAPMAELIEFGYRPILELMESDPADRARALEIYNGKTQWVRDQTLRGLRDRIGVSPQ